MKLWKFLSLLVIAAGLGLYIFKIERPAEVEKSVSQKPLSLVAQNAFKTVEVDRHAEPAFTLENTKVSSDDKPLTGDDWKVAGITGSTLDTTTLAAAVKELKNFKIQNALPESELSSDLSVYGLADPELKMLVNYESSAQPFEIKFGKRSDFLTQRYVEINYAGGKGIYLTDEALYTTANKEQTDYRNKLPFVISIGTADTVTIYRPGGAVTFEKKSPTTWDIKSPIAARASAAAVAKLISTIASLKANGFVDGDARNADDAAFQSPIAGLSVTSKGVDKVATFASKKEGDKAAEFLAKISGLDSILKLPADPTAELIKDVDAYREKQYFAFNTISANGLSVNRGADSLVLTKSEDVWTVNGKTGDRAFVDDYLKELSTLAAVGYATNVTDEAAGLSKPTLVATVKIPGGTPDAILTVGSLNPLNSNQYYAKVNGIDELFFIAADSLEKLFPSAEKLVEIMPQSTVAAAQ